MKLCKDGRLSCRHNFVYICSLITVYSPFDILLVPFRDLVKLPSLIVNKLNTVFYSTRGIDNRGYQMIIYLFHLFVLYIY